MRNYGSIPNKPTKPPAAPPPKKHIVMQCNSMFQTPEDKFFDASTDTHLRCVWLQVYIEVVKTKTRNEARMIADEALEDYLSKFSENK